MLILADSITGLRIDVYRFWWDGQGVQLSESGFTGFKDLQDNFSYQLTCSECRDLE